MPLLARLIAEVGIMSRDFSARKYIANQCDVYNDIRLKDALIEAFELMYQNREPDGCLSNSIALYVILRSYGYSPVLAFGLCISPEGNEFYHAWLELDNRILDISIYGNSHFSGYWLDANPTGPFVFENKNNIPVKYGNRVFDEDWPNCLISQAVSNMSIFDYIEGCPNDGMWRLIFRIIDEEYSLTRVKELRKFANAELMNEMEVSQ